MNYSIIPSFTPFKFQHFQITLQILGAGPYRHRHIGTAAPVRCRDADGTEWRAPVLGLRSGEGGDTAIGVGPWGTVVMPTLLGSLASLLELRSQCAMGWPWRVSGRSLRPLATLRHITKPCVRLCMNRCSRTLQRRGTCRHMIGLPAKRENRRKAAAVAAAVAAWPPCAPLLVTAPQGMNLESPYSNSSGIHESDNPTFRDS